MKNVKISDVLHLAADKYLTYNCDDWMLNFDKCRFSCDAVGMAIRELCLDGYHAHSIRLDLFEGLRNMGLNPYSISEFSEFENEDELISEKQQAARYTWLKFAAMIAEEQGV